MSNNNILDLIFEEDINSLKNKLLETKPSQINLVDENLNLTPLICAIDTDNEEIVKAILDAKADPNFTANGLSLPLIHAIEIAVEAEDYNPDVNETSTRIIELLIKYGADINQKNYDGVTPIEFSKNYHVAAYNLFRKLNQ
jgi:ankyrin repeat protein